MSPEELSAPPREDVPVSWLARFGRRNVAYIVFVVLLVPFALALEASGPQGPDAGGGVMAGIMLWALVSAVFFLVNAILLIVALSRNAPAGKPFLACALPAAVVIGVIVLSEMNLM